MKQQQGTEIKGCTLTLQLPIKACAYVCALRVRVPECGVMTAVVGQHSSGQQQSTAAADNTLIHIHFSHRGVSTLLPLFPLFLPVVF